MSGWNHHHPHFIDETKGILGTSDSLPHILLITNTSCGNLGATYTILLNVTKPASGIIFTFFNLYFIGASVKYELTNSSE